MSNTGNGKNLGIALLAVLGALALAAMTDSVTLQTILMLGVAAVLISALIQPRERRR